MNQLIWLDDSRPPHFPPLHCCSEEGLLAAGGKLSPEWLLLAYENGIFPWFSEHQPILWWSPDPRWVLFAEKLHLSRSMKKFLRKSPYRITKNTAFESVMKACAAPREPGGGTWILPQMIEAYGHLHELGFAHSWECWLDRELVGGVYGVQLGEVFFGESMFHRAANSSKQVLIHLLQQEDIRLLDCQMHSPHVEALGAMAISRQDFICEISRRA